MTTIAVGSTVGAYVQDNATWLLGLLGVVVWVVAELLLQRSRRSSTGIVFPRGGLVQESPPTRPVQPPQPSQEPPDESTDPSHRKRENREWIKNRFADDEEE